MSGDSCDIFYTITAYDSKCEQVHSVVCGLASDAYMLILLLCATLALITSVLVFRLALPHEKQMAGMFLMLKAYSFIVVFRFAFLLIGYWVG